MSAETCDGSSLVGRGVWMLCDDGLEPALRCVGSGDDGSDDVVGGVGEVGEAVGQAAAAEDEVAGVLVFGGAELGQQVQVVAQGLQFGVGVGGQVVAGVGERSVLHGGVLPRAGCKACLRARHAPAGCREGRSCNQPAGRISPKGVLFRHPPDVERTASEAPDALGIRNPPELPGRAPLIAGDSTLLGGKFASGMAGCLFTFSRRRNLDVETYDTRMSPYRFLRL